MSNNTMRYAIVTGGANGIGRAIALAFAKENYRVGVLDFDRDSLEEMLSLPEKENLVILPCDISNRAAVHDLVRGFAGQSEIDVLVNNAVAFHYDELVDFPEDKIDHMLNVGLKGTFWASQACIPFLLESKNASIINLSSIGAFVAIRTASVYTSIKGAIDALTRQQAAELGPKGIRVNAIAPGSIRTPGASAVITEEGWREREAKTFLQRLPEPEDVAKAALFLASDNARRITGVTLKVDCGMSIAGA